MEERLKERNDDRSEVWTFVMYILNCILRVIRTFGGFYYVLCRASTPLLYLRQVHASGGKRVPRAPLR